MFTMPAAQGGVGNEFVCAVKMRAHDFDQHDPEPERHQDLIFLRTRA